MEPPRACGLSLESAVEVVRLHVFDVEVVRPPLLLIDLLLAWPLCLLLWLGFLEGQLQPSCCALLLSQSPLLWCRGCPCWDWRLLCTFCWALNPSYRLPWPLYRCRVLSQPADNCYSDCVWGFNAYCGGKGLYSEQSSQIWKSPCERVLFWGFLISFV